MTTADASAELSIPWHSSTLRVVLLSTLLAPFSVALISPGLPVFRDAFGTTDAGASLLLLAGVGALVAAAALVLLTR